jgi:hypothetical protein
MRNTSIMSHNAWNDASFQVLPNLVGRYEWSGVVRDDLVQFQRLRDMKIFIFVGIG